MFICVDENLARTECRIFGNFSLGESFNFKGQDIRHLEDVTRLKMFPISAGIELLNVRLRRMKTFRDEFQQRRVRQPFQSRLLGMTARYIAYEFQVFVLDCVGRESPELDRASTDRLRRSW